MTICYPQIITARLCPRDELQFSLTPPTCVRVVPVYNDATYVISQFPPPVHFLIRDNGQVYQLADIQSPPSTPPEYHAILDSTGCILIGVELSAVTVTPLTNLQISLLPGVLRHVLQTLGLPLTSVTNTLPPQRCRPQLWQQILAATQDCLNTPPPPPPPPPGISCAFVLSCISAGQNISISPGGIISAGQLVPGPNPGEFTWLAPNGTPLFSFTTASFTINVLDTTTVDLTFSGGTLSADVVISSQPGNSLQVLPDGLYVASTSINVQDTATVDLTLSGGTLTADVNVSAAPNNGITINPDGLFVPATANPCLTFPPNLIFPPTFNYLATYSNNTGCIEQLFLNQEAVVYGNLVGTGAPQLDNLFYNPQRNYLRGVLSGSALMQNSVAMLNNSTINGSFSVNSAAIMRDSSVTNDVINSLVVFDNYNVGFSVNSVISGANGGISSSRFSTIVTENTPALLAEYSTIHARDSNISGIGFSFVSVDRAVTGTIYASTAIAINQPIAGLPAVVHGALYARDTFSQVGGVALFNFSLATSDNTTYQQTSYEASTIHTRDSLFRNDSPYNRSFIAVTESTLRGVNNSALFLSTTTNQQLFVSHSIVSNGNNNVSPARVGPPLPSIRASLLLNASQPLLDMGAALYVTTDTNLFASVTTSVIAAVEIAEFDPSPPTNTARVQSSVLVGRGLFISSIPIVSSLLLVGDRLAAGTQTVFGVGTQSYDTPAIIAAGGWRAYIADSGDPVGQNYFQGWDSAWRFRPFNASANYANNGAAIAALNGAYGTDPRIAIGTMAVARVAGTPAIFTWNGTTFVRITV